MKLYAKISSILCLLISLDLGISNFRTNIRQVIQDVGFIRWDFITFLFASFEFLLYFLPITLLTIPLWYYGWKKKDYNQ